jgi:hypothetical protein
MGGGETEYLFLCVVNCQDNATFVEILEKRSVFIIKNPFLNDCLLPHLSISYHMWQMADKTQQKSSKTL